MKLEITERNVVNYRETLRFLRARLDELAKLTKDYPVICEFSGMRVVFRSRQDIEKLINDIDDRIAAFESRAA